MKRIPALVCLLLSLLVSGCDTPQPPHPAGGTPDEPLHISSSALRIGPTGNPAAYRNIHHVSRPTLLAGEGEFRSAPLHIPPGVELETAFGISGGRYALIKGQGRGRAPAEPRPVDFDIRFQRLDDGTVETLHQETLDAAPDRNHQWWVERRITLAPVAGSTGRLIFRIGAVPLGVQSIKAKQEPVPVWAESVLHPAPTGSAGKLILLVSADTCRADALGAYGYHRPTTPHLDAFSRECLLFPNAYATSPWTLPSHASMLTATYPNVHQLETYRPTSLSSDITTVTECLAAQGFFTAAFVDMGFITPFKGLHRGFDVFDYRGRGIQTIGDRVFNWIADRPAADLFVFFHFYDIHYPYGERLPGLDFASAAAPPGYDVRGLGKNPPHNPAVAKHLRDLYDNGVAYTDMEFGRFLARLRQSGRYDEALILFLSDHGEEFGEHGRFGHQMALYQESLSIPLMIKVPDGNTAGGLNPLPASLVDLMPTILGFCDLDTPPQSEGIDLLGSDPVLADTRFVFGETVLKDNAEALVGRQFKLLHQPEIGLSYIDLRRNPDEGPAPSSQVSTEQQSAIKQSLTVTRLWRRPGVQLWFGGLEPGMPLEVEIHGRGLRAGQAFTYWAVVRQPEEQPPGQWRAQLEPREPVCGLVLGLAENPTGPLEVTVRLVDNGESRSVPLAAPRERDAQTGTLSCPLDGGPPPGAEAYSWIAAADAPRGMVHYRSRSPVAPAEEEDEEITARLLELGYVEE